MTNTIENDYTATDWALFLDEGNLLCRRIDTVAQWVQEWDDNTGALALYSDATETHSYVAKIEITGHRVRYEHGTARIRARVTFADPEVGTCGATLIKVGGKPFTKEDAQALAVS